MEEQGVNALSQNSSASPSLHGVNEPSESIGYIYNPNAQEGWVNDVLLLQKAMCEPKVQLLLSKNRQYCMKPVLDS